MKKFYLFGLVLLSVLSLTLSSCSKDDNETAKMIGTWGCTHLEGTFDGTAVDASFDPSNPTEVWVGDGISVSCSKYEIYKTTDGKFAMVLYAYWAENGEWEEYDTAYTKDDTSNKFYYSGNGYNGEITIESVTSTQLVANDNVTYETGYSYSYKLTMKRMK